MDRECVQHDTFWKRKELLNFLCKHIWLVLQRNKTNIVSSFMFEALEWNSLLVPSSSVRSCEIKVARPYCWERTDSDSLFPAFLHSVCKAFVFVLSLQAPPHCCSWPAGQTWGAFPWTPRISRTLCCRWRTSGMPSPSTLIPWKDTSTGQMTKWGPSAAPSSTAQAASSWSRLRSRTPMASQWTGWPATCTGRTPAQTASKSPGLMAPWGKSWYLKTWKNPELLCWIPWLGEELFVSIFKNISHLKKIPLLLCR